MKIEEEKLVRVIAFSPLVLLPLMIITICAILINSYNRDLDIELKNIENSLIEREKKAIEVKVDTIVDLIEYQNLHKKNSSDMTTLEMIRQITINHDKYIFIVSPKGKMLLNTSKTLQSNLETNGEKTKIIRRLMKSIFKTLKNKNRSHIVYNWENPKTKQMEIKYSFVRKTPSNAWYVGSGFYESDVKNLASEHRKELIANHDKKIEYIITIGSIAFIIFLIASVYFARVISRNFEQSREGLVSQNEKLKSLNEQLEHQILLRSNELEKSHKELEYLATTDTLTEIYNRNAILGLLDKEMIYAQNMEKPLCVVLFEVDKFNSIIDSHGHDIADDVLFKLTNIIAGSLRDTEFIGRYADHEFMVVLKNTSMDHAKLIADRIRSLISEYSFNEVGHITASLALVEYQNDQDIREVFKKLNQLIAKSKDEGGNKLNID